MDTKNAKKHIMVTSKWMRLGIMVVLSVIFGFLKWGIYMVAVVQAFNVLFTSKKNESFVALGQQLSEYAYQIMNYLTYNSDDKPFPFGAKFPSSR